jgi:N4-gp56 family major capsid protein
MASQTVGRTFNDPANGSPSSVGVQINNFFFQKKALIDIAREAYFGQLADTISMPKNMGQKIRRYHYMPLLDERNLNDQGIDAAGVEIKNTDYFVTLPRAVLQIANASAAGAVTAINANAGYAGATVVAVAGAADSGGTGLANITVTGPLTFKVDTVTKANAIVALNLGAFSKQGSGNLYGSAKDVGSISGKLPAVSETGGRVNRVGFKRIELEGTFEKFGFFDEYTQDSIDFDTDADLAQHLNTEMLKGANQMTEAALQVDLLNNAGTIRYAGAATSKSTVTATTVTYGDLMRLSIDLDNNRTPKSTKIITGSRMIDTATIMGGRVAYIGSELIPTFKAMKDLHNNPAFVPVHRYADAGTVIHGEIGSIDAFRFVVVPEMQKWAGAGGDASATTTHYETGQRYDVFPILVVGDESFTTIGFQTDGKSVKFKITHKAPGEATADRFDPYGETGFTSIKWWYGFMSLRPERLGMILTSATL